MTHIDPNATTEACLEIAQREAGDESYDRIRERLAREIGGWISVVLNEEHDVYLVTGDDYRRLRALDAALAVAR